MGIEERQHKGCSRQQKKLEAQYCSVNSLALIRLAQVLLEVFPALSSAQSQVWDWNAFKCSRKWSFTITVHSNGIKSSSSFRGTYALLFLYPASLSHEPFRKHKKTPVPQELSHNVKVQVMHFQTSVSLNLTKSYIHILQSFFSLQPVERNCLKV